MFKMDKDNFKDDLKRFMSTPRDLSKATNKSKAEILTLHFIGFVAKPTGISQRIYLLCLEAFNSNRGKTELEIEAVLRVLELKGANNGQ